MSFAKKLRMNARILNWVSVAVLVTASLLPALLTNMRVDAAQVTARSIALATSAPDAETSYTITFTVADTGAENVGAFLVEFCDSDPLPHEPCTYDAVGDDIPQVDGNAGSAAALNGSPTFDSQAISLTAPSVGDRFLQFTLASATDISSDTQFQVTVDNVDNPDNSTDNPGADNNTFYARIYVYNTNAPGAPAAPVATTNVIHDGGIAMSTANQLTITARVQEVLEFCVGNADAATNDDCTDISGTTINMGVLDANSITESSDRAPGNTETHGYLMMRTNGLNGLNLTYLGDTLTSGANTITAVGATEASMTNGVTAFGMDVVDVDDNTEASSAVDTTNGTTSNLSLDSDFDTLDQYTYLGSPTVADTIATSGSVLDDEMVIMDFAGTVSNLVPTGIYTTTVTFIATALF